MLRSGIAHRKTSELSSDTHVAPVWQHSPEPQSTGSEPQMANFPRIFPVVQSAATEATIAAIAVKTNVLKSMMKNVEKKSTRLRNEWSGKRTTSKNGAEKTKSYSSRPEKELHCR
jgi:hypothetical protein